MRNAARLLVFGVALWPAPGKGDDAWIFATEVVEVRVHDRRFVVEGSYEFRFDRGAEDLPVLYPFPQDSELGLVEVDYLRIRYPGGMVWEPPFHSEPRALHFVIPARGGGSCVLEVRYEQPAKSGRARYILHSVLDWGRPLERAELRVDVAAADSVLIEPRMREVPAAEGRRRFVTIRADWLPSSDLRVEPVTIYPSANDDDVVAAPPR